MVREDKRFWRRKFGVACSSRYKSSLHKVTWLLREGKNKRQKWTVGGQLEARWWGNNPPPTRREQAEDGTLAALRVVAIRLADVSWEGGREEGRVRLPLTITATFTGV